MAPSGHQTSNDDVTISDDLGWSKIDRFHSLDMRDPGKNPVWDHLSNQINKIMIIL